MKWIRKHWPETLIIGIPAVFILVAIRALLAGDARKADCNVACRPHIGGYVEGRCHCLDDEERWVPATTQEGK